MAFDFMNCTAGSAAWNSSLNVTVLKTPLQDCIGNRLIWAVGDPLLAALLFIGFFGVFVMMQDTRLDVKVAVMIPVIVLAIGITGLGWLVSLAIMVFALILLAALLKIFNR